MVGSFEEWIVSAVLGVARNCWHDGIGVPVKGRHEATMVEEVFGRVRAVVEAIVIGANVVSALVVRNDGDDIQPSSNILS